MQLIYIDSERSTHRESYVAHVAEAEDNQLVEQLDAAQTQHPHTTINQVCVVNHEVDGSRPKRTWTEAVKKTVKHIN